MKLSQASVASLGQVLIKLVIILQRRLGMSHLSQEFIITKLVQTRDIQTSSFIVEFRLKCPDDKPQL